MAKTDQYQDWQAANQQREDEAKAVARQATGFDFHAAIKELAEAQWVRQSLPDFEGDSPSSIGTQSMEAPFVSLRVPCPHIGNRGEAAKWHQGCVCQGRRWVPEPDIRVACWGVEDVLIKAGWSVTYAEGYGYAVTNAKGHALVMSEPVQTKAVLRAALAWADKRGG